MNVKTQICLQFKSYGCVCVCVCMYVNMRLPVTLADLDFFNPHAGYSAIGLQSSLLNRQAIIHAGVSEQKDVESRHVNR